MRAALCLALAACTANSAQQQFPDASPPADSSFDGRRPDAARGPGPDAGRPPLECFVDASLADAAPGDPFAIAAGQRRPSRVGTNGAQVFWANAGDACGAGSVVRAELDGTAQAGLSPAPLMSACQLVVDARAVYFVDCGSDRALYRADLGGGGAYLGQTPNPGGLAVDTSWLYWLDRGGGLTDGRLLRLARWAATPDPATELVTGLHQPTVVVADDAGVYWVSDAGASIMRLADNQPVMTGLAAVTALALDADTLYWTETGTSGNGLVRAVDRSGGSPRTLASGQVQPVALAVDATAVYWTSLDGRVQQVAKLGGPVTLIADGQLEPSSIAVAAQFVYWTDSRRGTVMRAPK